MPPDDAETAHAKLNLALHVRRRRDDGYHELETLFVFCEDGDSLRVTPSDTLSLKVEGRFGAGLEDDDNLVMRAARALRQASGHDRGAALTLDKRLPVASGIGGGSADAAAALRLLNRHWGLEWPPERLAELALPLGADVPACVHSRTMRGEGVGERLEPVSGKGLAGMPVLLVNPLVAVSTADVFRGWDGEDRGPLPEGDILGAARQGRNDLTEAATAIAPVISDVLTMLGGGTGPDLVRMSGSGATCFALAEGEGQQLRLAKRIKELRPDWWVLQTRLR